ncbi:hypothetical protein EDC94DRAFT_600407 [Helicostylum pulchrum]|nr:hypothetical protein EDC94DRAFT_600407 [Helicostylum pulchrum]
MLGLNLSIVSILLFFVMLQSYAVEGSYYCCGCSGPICMEVASNICAGNDNVHYGSGSCKSGWWPCETDRGCRFGVRGPFFDDT